MSIIKSAYELAMERAENFKISPEDLKKNEIIKKGKNAGSRHLCDSSFDLKESLNEYKNKELSWFKEGISWTLNTNIKLPVNEKDILTLKNIKEGFLKIAEKSNEVEYIFRQMAELFQKYIEDSQQLYENCAAEYKPKFQEKVLKMAQQTGHMPNLNMDEDPDFRSFYSRQSSKLETHYKNFIEEIKKEITERV